MTLCKAGSDLSAWVACWLCHSGVFRMEWQRLCPSSGHKEAQTHSPQAEKSVWGGFSCLLPSAGPCSTSQGSAAPKDKTPSTLSRGLSWVHTLLQGRYIPSAGQLSLRDPGWGVP